MTNVKKVERSQHQFLKSPKSDPFDPRLTADPSHCFFSHISRPYNFRFDNNKASTLIANYADTS